MKHFRSIDGVRGWLAWSVVVSHIVLLSAADQWKPVLAYFDSAGFFAVPCFIIISGFVITHLLLEKREPYLPYIARRFLRVYPSYLCCLLFGVFATYLFLGAFADHPWGVYVPQPELLQMEVATSRGAPLAWHLLAHLTMLHGMISNDVLAASQFMFLGPAWSLSLEWQFYLFAPLILSGIRTQWGRIVVCVATVVGFAAFQKGWLGTFYDPSFLPGAGLYFAVGIASRLLYPKLPTFSSYPIAAMILAGGLVMLAHQLFPFVLWMAFMAWLRVEHPTDALSQHVDRCLEVAFNSKLARYLGTRSYSTYLVHEPIIHSVVYLCIKQWSLGIGATFVVLVITVPVTTLAASVLLWKYVEEPAIAFGKRQFNDPDTSRTVLAAARS